MGIRFHCFACQEPLNVKNELAGKRGKCPRCGERFRVPFADQATADPLEPEPAAPVKAAVSASPAAKPVAAVAPVPAPAPPSPPSPPPSPPVPASDPLDEVPSACWYLRPASGGQYGPATADMMRQWLQEQRVGATALLWREGWPTWRTATEVFPHLAALAAAQGLTAQGLTAQGQTAPQPAGVAAHGAVDESLIKQDPVKESVASKKRETSKRRVVIVAGLIVTSLVLIAGLVAVLMLK